MAEIFKSTTAASSSSSPACKVPKRRNERNILTFYEKIAVIRYYDETNISRNSLAKMFHCCATQIRRILEKKQELMQQLATLSEADASIIIEEMTRKRRKFEMSAISFILHQWVERCRQLRLRKAITNQTLKETALKMAAILNLPSFRPSYRWLNRFRGKYKYSAQDLCVNGESGGVSGELAVEDIIIEFKDSLPSFMQKEISAITSSVKADDKLAELTKIKTLENALMLNNSTNEEDYEDDVVEVQPIENPKATVWDEDLGDSNSLSISSDETASDPNELITESHAGGLLNAGSSALLNGIFPHLAVIHQFALLNSDVKALELISQLGVHMQAQATSGAYKQLSLATPSNQLQGSRTEVPGSIYADIDDIVLME